jgi:hypothetical protein
MRYAVKMFYRARAKDPAIVGMPRRHMQSMDRPGTLRETPRLTDIRADGLSQPDSAGSFSPTLLKLMAECASSSWPFTSSSPCWGGGWITGDPGNGSGISTMA